MIFFLKTIFFLPAQPGSPLKPSVVSSAYMHVFRIRKHACFLLHCEGRICKRKGAFFSNSGLTP